MMMDLKKQMEQVILEQYKNTEGMVVLKKGKVVYEKYFHECVAATTIHIFSVTKSIISALTGIAIDKGFIKSTEQKVLDFFPDYKVKKGEKNIQHITLKNLLTMTAPYKYKEEPYAQYFGADSWVKAALDFLGGSDETGKFRYAPVIGPDILSGILVKATGRPVLDFAREYLFSPMNIKVEKCIRLHDQKEQSHFYENYDQKGWVCDPQGINTAGWGLNLTPLDMAKIGQLYLDHGIWQKNRLISSRWIMESTMPKSSWNEMKYGYLWWVIDEHEHAYAAIGDGGNIIYVNEKKKIVVAMAGFFVPHAEDRIQLIKNFIEPAFEQD